MYFYVYDEFVQDAKFERDLAQVETRLTDLGISGKIARLALFRDPEEFIADEVKNGAKTVIAVGNDLTIRKVIDSVVDRGVTIAIIPIGTQNNVIADMIGVPVGVEACDTLSARIIEKLDVGVVNGQRFIHTVNIECNSNMRVACDGMFDIVVPRKTMVMMRNLALETDILAASNPVDGNLEFMVPRSEKGWFKKKAEPTRVFVKEALITADKPMKLSVDGQEQEAEQIHFRIIPQHLKLVTGKERKF